MKYLPLIAALTLCACSSLFPEKEAPRLFTLSVPRTQAQTPAAPLPLALQVMLPQASPLLDSERIAIKLQGQEMSYIDGGRWTGPLPRMLQMQLVEALENQRGFASVGSDLVPVRADYALAVELRDFQAEYSGASVLARVRFTVRIVDTESYNVVATLPYEETENASGNTMLDITAACNAAFNRASARMAQDVANALAPRVQAASALL